MRRAFALSICAAFFAAVTPASSFAQVLGVSQVDVVVVDPQRLFRETLFGQRIAEELEAEAQALAARNRELEEELRVEERELTERRPDMSAQDFRDAAEAFDKKVQAIRRERQEKAQALEDKRGSAEQRFLLTAQDVLVEVMNERGANLLLDIRSVLLRDNAVDITSEAVRKIDEAIGTGAAAQVPQDDQ